VQVPGRRAALLAPVGLLLALIVSGCGGGGGRAQAAAPCGTCAAALAQARADAFASVARRMYDQEVSGAANGAAFHVISRLPALLEGIATDDYAAAIYAIEHQPIRHAVAVRVTRGQRALIDVGLRFVVGGRIRPLRNVDGTYLGGIEISIQDVIGFVRLIRRLTGAQAVVQGSTGQTMTTFKDGADLALPARGPVVVAGRQYTVSSFTERGFAGEPLHVFVLAPS
jgi:hypothetical protein